VTTKSGEFRVVIFSGGHVPTICRLISRIQTEVPNARVCGVLIERRPGKTRLKRISSFFTNLRDPDFVQYAAGRCAKNGRAQLEKLFSSFLHFVHAGRPPETTTEEPACPLCVTTDYHRADALEFVKRLQPDLGIVYGTRILKPALFSIPRLGSINIHKRKVPDYKGGGPVGLWELLDGQNEIGVTVHEVTEKLDAGAIINCATIPIEPFDNLTSLALKAHVVGNDLLVRSIAEFSAGTVVRTQQQGTGKMFKSPTPQQLAKYERVLAQRRRAFRPASSRTSAKLMMKTAVALPAVTARNWGNRIRGSFPLTILFHHLVSDRPHRMGISTEYFLKHVEFLRRHYQIVSLPRGIEMLRTHSLKKPTVVLTFDDGYRDNFINLRAVVEQTGIPVTLFVSTAHVSRQVEFKHDIDAGLKNFTPLTWEQLRQMHRQGFTIGSHTRTHFDCGSRNVGRLQDEIVGSKNDLEQHLGIRIEFFSFPFGLPENISPEAAELAARNYRYVLSAFGGNNIPQVNGAVKHLTRWWHANDLWNLELLMHGALESVPVLSVDLSSNAEQIRTEEAALGPLVPE
jgi:peptidoglycan/xylan/chitin deacetylase (PgdA/CDA1 family)/folate-dependent phosphoribosylglycinamide formyltransferase PurN